MRVKAKCHECHTEMEKLVPEGTTSPPLWECACGAKFFHMIIYPPWVLIFGQGIRLFNELDYRIACHEFGSAFEVFQKAVLDTLLRDINTPDIVIDMIFQTRFDREPG